MFACLARLLAYLSRCYLKGRETHLRGKKWASVILPQKLCKSPEVLSSMPLLKSRTTGPCPGCPWSANGIQRSDMKSTSPPLIYFVHFPRISAHLCSSNQCPPSVHPTHPVLLNIAFTSCSPPDMHIPYFLLVTFSILTWLTSIA